MMKMWSRVCVCAQRSSLIIISQWNHATNREKISNEGNSSCRDFKKLFTFRSVFPASFSLPNVWHQPKNPLGWRWLAVIYWWRNEKNFIHAIAFGSIDCPMTINTWSWIVFAISVHKFKSDAGGLSFSIWIFVVEEFDEIEILSIIDQFNGLENEKERRHLSIVDEHTSRTEETDRMSFVKFWYLLFTTLSKLI